MLDFSPQNIMRWSRMGMRKAYGTILNDLAEDHDDIMCIAADVVDPAGLAVFEKDRPDRLMNVGISEQNMVAMAAGLAKEGANVFVTSFAPFVSLRAYEAVRTLVCFMNLNVKIVALASGFSLGVQGATHYALEDIAIMRVIPNLLVLSPSDTTEMAKMMEYLVDYKGPAYLRLTGLPGGALVYKAGFKYKVNNLDVIRDGTDIGIIATGTLVGEAIRASRLLIKNKIKVGIINLSSVNPKCKEQLLDECMKYKMIVTIEEHSIVGGIGSFVSETLTTVENHPRLISLGTVSSNQESGSYSFMMEKNGLSAKLIALAVVKAYKKSLIYAG